MTLSKLRLPVFFMATITMICTLAVYGANDISAQTVPGYRLVNTYNEDNGTITSDIYVTDGLALVGQLGLCYDTELVTVAIPLTDGRIITEYEEQMASGKLKVTNFVTADNKCVITSETNKLYDLINEEVGEFFFAWYLGGSTKLDATSEDKRIATVTFKVNDGVSAQDIEKAGNDVVSFSSHTPSETKVVGYSSGAYVANEENTAVRNNGRSKLSITLKTEYVGLDIAGGFTVNIKNDHHGITIPDTHRTSKRIMTVPMGTDPEKITSAFALPTGMTSEFYAKDEVSEPMTVKTGDSAILTKGNHTETILIAVESDTDGDGNATMADLNTMMRILSGSIGDPAEEAIYAVDTNGDGQLSDAEYDGFVADIIENNK